MLMYNYSKALRSEVVVLLPTDHDVQGLISGWSNSVAIGNTFSDLHLKIDMKKNKIIKMEYINDLCVNPAV